MTNIHARLGFGVQMKHILCVLLLFSFTNAASAKATKKSSKQQASYSKSYDSSSKQYNIRAQAIHLLIGAASLSFDYKIHPEWTIGPTATYWRYSMSSDSNYFIEKYDVTYFALGVKANWFPQGVFNDGLYIAPNLSYVSAKVQTKDTAGDPVTGTGSVTMLGGLVGYAWFWENFNMMLGGGAKLGLGNTKVEVKSASGTEVSVTSPVAGFDFEFTVGWTF